MREVAALVRAQWLVALTYRTRMLFSILGVLVGVVPVFIISRALQEVAAPSLVGEGSQLFAFLVVGTVGLVFITSALVALPTAIGSGISTGTWESLLATPARVWGLLAALSVYDLLWNVAKAAALLAAAAALGARFEWGALMLALGILALIVIAYLAIGVIAGALQLAFRSTTPLPRVVLIASVFLGGVYYPTSAIPDGFRVLSEWIPLTYGLRALRRSLLEGWRLSQILPDLEMLLLFDAVLATVAALAFAAALRHARRAGTLSQY
ncbi:MAG TPA: ABC transporter permease [Gemmatimonadales bacterium]